MTPNDINATQAIATAIMLCQPINLPYDYGTNIVFTAVAGKFFFRRICSQRLIYGRFRFKEELLNPHSDVLLLLYRQYTNTVINSDPVINSPSSTGPSSLSMESCKSYEIKWLLAGKFFSAVQNTAEIHLWFGYQRDTVMFYKYRHKVWYHLSLYPNRSMPRFSHAQTHTHHSCFCTQANHAVQRASRGQRARNPREASAIYLLSGCLGSLHNLQLWQCA